MGFLALRLVFQIKRFAIRSLGYWSARILGVRIVGIIRVIGIHGVIGVIGLIRFNGMIRIILGTFGIISRILWRAVRVSSHGPSRILGIGVVGIIRVIGIFGIIGIIGRYPWRVNGVAMNSVNFSTVFICPEGSPMIPEKKCEVWREVGFLEGRRK